VIERDNIVVDGAGYTLQGTNAYESRGIDVTERSNVTIKNIEIKTFVDGIYIWASSNNTIFGNNITENNRYGIVLASSSNYNNISGNKIADNMFGIKLYYFSNYNNVSGNHITTNNLEGIWLSHFSNYNSISRNNITENNEYGIWLYVSSAYNSISGNNITTNNLYGIYLDYSSGNNIYHNNFVSNTQQAYSEESINIWDDGYPSGGNYWSDYQEKYPNATEIDDSGIWNIPYVIDSNNIDNYPIVPEFPSFIILPPFMIATLLAAIVYKRKHIVKG
jgi:parallel beta-helix repeat protein